MKSREGIQLRKLSTNLQFKRKFFYLKLLFILYTFKKLYGLVRNKNICMDLQKYNII